MTNDLEEFSEKLNQFSCRLINIAKGHREAGRENSLAFDHFGRYVSCIMAVKTLLFSLNLAGSNKKFAEFYIKDLPKELHDSSTSAQLKIAHQFIKETHHAIRFVLFQNFYSQTETTFRIIQRSIYPEKTGRNPFKLISENYGIMIDGTTDFLIDIRNTVHNNGRYFPSDGIDKEHIFQGKTFRFTQGKAIYSVTMSDIILIIDFLITETEQLFQDSDLATIRV